jgi:hypothetical protein
MSSRLLSAAFAVAIVATAASPASATSCQAWRRLTEPQRWDRVYRMIDDAIAGQDGRELRVNRAAIGRCLERRAESMYWDFDDTCADSGTAGSQAINRLFKRYIWNCL